MGQLLIIGSEDIFRIDREEVAASPKNDFRSRLRGAFVHLRSGCTVVGSSFAGENDLFSPEAGNIAWRDVAGMRVLENGDGIRQAVRFQGATQGTEIMVSVIDTVVLIGEGLHALEIF